MKHKKRIRLNIYLNASIALRLRCYGAPLKTYYFYEHKISYWP